MHLSWNIKARSLLDSRIILLGVCTALFRGSLYIWVIEWTPALQAAKYGFTPSRLPFGMIFAIYNVSLY